MGSVALSQLFLSSYVQLNAINETRETDTINGVINVQIPDRKILS